MELQVVIKVDDPDKALRVIDNERLDAEKFSSRAVVLTLDPTLGDSVTALKGDRVRVVQDSFTATVNDAEIVEVLPR